jgi:RNA polymerase sigma-70 factor (ECF subfamily)
MSSTADDDDLKRLAGTSRAAAIDALARRHGRSLLGHATSILHDPEEAADVLQEVLIRAMREPRLFDEAFAVRAWLYRVTTNLCYNRSRDRRRRAAILEHGLRHEPRPAESRDPAEASRQSHSFQGVLAQLSPAHREILQLRYWEDLSYAEIADVLQVRMGTVMSRLSRARDQFHLRAPAPALSG